MPTTYGASVTIDELTFRPFTREEQPKALDLLYRAFGDSVSDADREDEMLVLDHRSSHAAFDGDQTQSNFIFAGRMCETLALGALASRFPNQKLKYDSKSMTFPDFPEANQWVRTEYRNGWQVKGLSESS